MRNYASDPVSFETAASGTLKGQYLGKGSLERLLTHWAPTPDQPASSVYVRPGEVAEFLETVGPQGRDWVARLFALGTAVVKSDTGIVGLRAGDEALVVLPGIPVLQNRLTPSRDIAPLLGLLNAQYTIGVVLLRLGRYSVAVYEGTQLASSKTDARYVKGRHHAGGSSQKRFQRIREGQVRKIYDDACEVVRTQFDPYSRQLDYILLGGERLTLIGFLKVCPYLAQFRGITLGRRLNIRDPKRDTLEAVGDMLLESRVFQLQWYQGLSETENSPQSTQRPLR